MPKYFWALEIGRSKKGIFICQRKYALDLLQDTGMLGCKPHNTPMDANISLSQEGDGLCDQKEYKRLVGRLLHLCITRPNLTYAMHKLSQFVSKPYSHHMAATQRVLRYIKGTAGNGLLVPSVSDLELKVFADAVWASCLDTRCSVTGFCTFLGDSILAWRSKKQSIASRSSAEADYRAMSQATCEVVWLLNLLGDIGIKKLKVVPLHCDNKAAVYITSNCTFHERTKHIVIDCHTIRERYLKGIIKPLHIKGEQ